MIKSLKRTIPVEKAYFLWLCDRIDRRTSFKFEHLLSSLYGYEFYGLVPNDNNRAEDGIKLRECFARENGYGDLYEIDGPCSVLEMIVALAQRMESILYDPSNGDQTAKWFWTLIENLRLLPLDPRDPHIDTSKGRNDLIIKRFLARKYFPNGYGGLFPLRHPKEDQRKVEIWYQMMAYLEEQYGF